MGPGSEPGTQTAPAEAWRPQALPLAAAGTQHLPLPAALSPHCIARTGLGTRTTAGIPKAPEEAGKEGVGDGWDFQRVQKQTQWDKTLSQWKDSKVCWDGCDMKGGWVLGPKGGCPRLVPAQPTG